jgi:acetyl esterase/lipase
MLLLLGLTLSFPAAVPLAALGQDSEKPLVVELWPGRAPGETAEGGPDVEKGKSVTGVTRPTIRVSRPAKDKDTGAAILICPGGAYRVLAFEHEGTQVASWLNSIGLTAVLLRYRVPQRPGDTDNVCPLQDAQRAMGIARSRGAEWGIDPKRLGVMGFSAGGHLAAHLSTNCEHRAYPAVDSADESSCRPDFQILVYPGGILDRQDKEKLSPQIRVSKDTPPCLLVAASDDKGAVPGMLRLYQALRESGISSELHLYAAGGHGFGMHPSDQPFGSWTRRCEEWMRSRGTLKPQAGAEGK